MKKIIIEPKNPLDIKPGELKGLAEEIRSLCPDCDVKIEGRGYRGYAVTWWECVLIWVAFRASDNLIEQIVKLATEWARERFAKEGKEKRPKSIKIYGPYGYIVSEVVLKNGTDEPEIRTPSKEETRERFRPPFKRETFFRTLWHKLFKSKRPKV